MLIPIPIIPVSRISEPINRYRYRYLLIKWVKPNIVLAVFRRSSLSCQYASEPTQLLLSPLTNATTPNLWFHLVIISVPLGPKGPISLTRTSLWKMAGDNNYSSPQVPPPPLFVEDKRDPTDQY